MSGTGGLADDLARLASLVFTARRLVAGGALVDLSAIEERVKEVCGTVVALPRDEGRGLVGELQSLIGKLDGLSEDLRERLERFGGPVGNLPTHG